MAKRSLASIDHPVMSRFYHFDYNQTSQILPKKYNETSLHYNNPLINFAYTSNVKKGTLSCKSSYSLVLQTIKHKSVAWGIDAKGPLPSEGANINRMPRATTAQSSSVFFLLHERVVGHPSNRRSSKSRMLAPLIFLHGCNTTYIVGKNIEGSLNYCNKLIKEQKS